MAHKFKFILKHFWAHWQLYWSEKQQKVFHSDTWNFSQGRDQKTNPT